MAINRATYKNIYEQDLVKARISTKTECVFICHQKKDSVACRKIADYLLNADIDVYFDEFDDNLRTTNPTQVVNAIKAGIEKSSHMLCVVSHNTLDSKWVPFEIGYGYDKTELSVLRLKDLPKSSLPDYLKVATVINDIWDFNSLIARKKKADKDLLEKAFTIKNYSDSLHPLKDIMDKI